MTYNYKEGVIVPFVQKFYKQMIVVVAGLFIASMAVMTFNASAAPTTFSFTADELTNNWEADRYFPTDGVTSVSSFDRNNVARIGIDGGDTQTGIFQRTEGIKTKGVKNFGNEVQVDLYLDPTWDNTAVRAGLWVVDDNGSGARNKFGIIEFVNNETCSADNCSNQGNITQHEGFRVYNSGWMPNLTTSFEYGKWVTLNIKLDTVNSMYRYSINGAEVATASAGNSFIREVFLNSYNYGQDNFPNLNSNSYAAHWHGGVQPAKAAPAVASDLLKEAGISPKYGVKGKGNYIADVAKVMGATTDFNGVAKVDIAAYRCKVAQFLESKNPAIIASQQCLILLDTVVVPADSTRNTYSNVITAYEGL